MTNEWLLPHGWAAQVTCEGTAVLQYQASLFFQGDLRCRLSLVDDGADRDAAEAHLHERALNWISEYMQRAPLTDLAGGVSELATVPARSLSQALPLPREAGPV